MSSQQRIAILSALLIGCAFLPAKLIAQLSFQPSQVAQTALDAQTSNQANNGQGAIITFNAPGALDTYLTGINAMGLITGHYFGSDFIPHGFLRYCAQPSQGGCSKGNSTFGTFDPPGSYGTYPQAINDMGTVAGFYVDANSNSHGFVRLCNHPGSEGACSEGDTVFITFDAPLSVFGTNPTSINNKGNVTGTYLAANGATHGFILECDPQDGGKPCDNNAPAITTLDVPSALSTAPNSINAKGQITGSFFGTDAVNHGFVADCAGKSEEKDCETEGRSFATFDLPNAISTNPNAINSRGEVTGFYIDDGNVSHGFLRRPDGTLVSFDAVGSVGTTPASINSSGEITGNSIDANNVIHGFLRRPNGTIITFNASTNLNTFPTSINARGEITGDFVDANFAQHGFLRLPNEN